VRNSTFNIVLSSIEVQPQENNPFLVRAKFIFADTKPNENGMGIDFEDFPAVAASAINMPVKMRYLGEGIGNHAGSIPIGHITDMSIEGGPEDGKLVGSAALYSDEYPDEVAFLINAFAENNAPGISWELAYTESVVINGIHWLKGIITKAATFVKNPAYGKRTALLALASNHDLTDEELDEEILKLTIKEASSTETGGNKVNEEELQKQIDQLKEALSTKESELETLKTQHNSVVEENGTLKEQLSAITKSAKIEERTRKWMEAGLSFSEDAEKATEKKEFIASLEDSVFDAYLSDLVAVKATVKPAAEASASSGTKIPKPNLTEQDKEMSFEDLRLAVKAAARS
jgi:regulator of replication initiation timing